MEHLYKDILQDTPDLDEKLLQRFLKQFKKPNVQANRTFRDTLKRKLNKKIQEKKEAQERKVLAGIPSFAKRRFRLTGFATAVCAFLFIFVLSFFTDFFSNKLFIPSKYIQKDTAFEIQTTNPTTSNQAKQQAKVANNGIMTMEIATETLSTADQQDGGYLYDGKKYPKVAGEMPVYKRAWSLINDDLLKRSIWGLKFGDTSLKVFKELAINDISFSEKSGDYQIRVNVGGGSLSISSMNTSLNDAFDSASLPSLSAKEVKKAVATQLKAMGISLANYGDPIVHFPKITFPEDERTILIEYPFQLNGFAVWNSNNNRESWSVLPTSPTPLMMTVAYDRVKGKIVNLSSIDIAKYEYANYPTLSKDEVLKEFTVGIKPLHAPEIIYLQKDINGEKYYVPWLRFAIDEEKAVYKELVEL